MLHLCGYPRPTMDDLKQFRQLDSVTPGHPENHMLPGVEVTTGPLGQGISNAVGLAIAEAQISATYPEAPINNYTFVICGDGCLQEGISSEAGSLAGHLKLGKLIVLYDDNKITIDGSTDISFTEDVLKRYESYGWQVLSVADGDNDLAGIEEAVKIAQETTNAPTLIKVTTKIGFGSKKAGHHDVHGAPLGNDDLKYVKNNFGFDPEKTFFVDDDVKSHFSNVITRGNELETEWNKRMDEFKSKNPEKASEFERRLAGKLPEGWEKKLPSYNVSSGSIASRNSSEKVLNAIADAIPEIVGGSADLTGSNKTQIKNSFDFQAKTPAGRYIRFGVREHAMAAICNGIAAYGGFIPFGATFLNFAGYMLGAMLLSALSHLRVFYILTHDSIGLGEDGPTHQPVATLISLRSIPNMYVFRPADATEVVGSYKKALTLNHSPSCFALSRQNLPTLEHTSVEGVALGGYTIIKPTSGNDPKVILVSTGSEVYIAVDAAKILNDEGIPTSVVSMPCTNLFDEQSIEYKKSVFLQNSVVISLEASSVEGWAKYSHYQIGMKEFGKSAPFEKVYEYFGFTPKAVSQKSKDVLKHFEGKQIPWIMDFPQ